MIARHLFELAGALFPAIRDVFRVRIDSNVVVTEKRKIAAAAADFENSAWIQHLDSLAEQCPQREGLASANERVSAMKTFLDPTKNKTGLHISNLTI